MARSVDAGLLVLRLWLGLSLLLLHGWSKLATFSEKVSKFPDPIGVGPSISPAQTMILAEVGCAVLIVAGLFTRAAALVQAVLMSVAFFIVHKASLASGPGGGKLAIIYLSGFVILLLAGAGSVSFDDVFGANKATK